MSSHGIYVHSPLGLVSASVTASLKLSSLLPEGFCSPSTPHILWWSLAASPKPARFPHDRPQPGKCLWSSVRSMLPFSRGSPRASGWGCLCSVTRVNTWHPTPAYLFAAVLCWMRCMNWEDSPRCPFRVKTGSTPSTCSSDHPLSQGPDASSLAVQCPSSVPRTPAWFCCKACWHPHFPPGRRRSEAGTTLYTSLHPPPVLCCSAHSSCSIKVCGRNDQGDEGKMHDSGLFVCFP